MSSGIWGLLRDLLARGPLELEQGEDVPLLLAHASQNAPHLALGVTTERGRLRPVEGLLGLRGAEPLREGLPDAATPKAVSHSIAREPEQERAERAGANPRHVLERRGEHFLRHVLCLIGGESEAARAGHHDTRVAVVEDAHRRLLAPAAAREELLLFCVRRGNLRLKLHGDVR